MSSRNQMNQYLIERQRVLKYQLEPKLFVVNDHVSIYFGLIIWFKFLF